MGVSQKMTHRIKFWVKLGEPMSTEHMEELNDQQIVRREKNGCAREQGIDPFEKRFERTANSQELKDKLRNLIKNNEIKRNCYYRWTLSN